MSNERRNSVADWRTMFGSKIQTSESVPIDLRIMFGLRSQEHKPAPPLLTLKPIVWRKIQKANCN